MTDMWMGAAVVLVILLLPIIIPLAYYFINRDGFRKHGIWIWLSAGVAELLLLFLMAPLII